MHIRRCSVSCGSSLETERCRSGCRQIYSSLPFRRRVARQQIRCRDKVLDRRSGESDDELDTSITLEIKQRADPRYLSKVAKRLDVVWTVSSRKVCLFLGQIMAPAFCALEADNNFAVYRDASLDSAPAVEAQA